MSIYGSYEDMRDWQRREAGDDSPQSHVFIPGEDFDPYDEDDVAAVKLVGERDKADKAEYWKQRALAAEARLAKDDIGALFPDLDSPYENYDPPFDQEIR